MINAVKTLIERLKGKVPKGKKRSSKWRKVRNNHIKENPICAVCHSSKKLEVHHIIPFHVAPDLELEPSNLITLCEHGRFKSMNCHLLWGHMASWRNVNVNCVLDVTVMHEKLKQMEMIR